MKKRNLCKVVHAKQEADFSKIIAHDGLSQRLSISMTLLISQRTWNVTTMVSNDINARTAVGMREVYDDIFEVRLDAMNDVRERTRSVWLWKPFDQMVVRSEVDGLWNSVWMDLLRRP